MWTSLARPPAFGLGVPTNHLRKKCSFVKLAQVLVMKATVFVNLVALLGLWFSTTFPVMHINLLTMDGTHHTSRHPHSWQPYSNTKTTHISWVLRWHASSRVVSGSWTTGRASTVEANSTRHCPSRPTWDHTKTFHLASLGHGIFRVH